MEKKCREARNVKSIIVIENLCSTLQKIENCGNRSKSSSPIVYESLSIAAVGVPKGLRVRVTAMSVSSMIRRCKCN